MTLDRSGYGPWTFSPSRSDSAAGSMRAAATRIEQGLIQRLGALQCDLHRKTPVRRVDGPPPQALTQIRVAGSRLDRGG